MDRKEAVSIFLEKVKQAYITDQQAKDIRASGKSAESIKPESGNDFGKLFGADYFTQQRIGQPPGKWPSIEDIIQWMKDKKTFRVDAERGASLKSVAFLIARKIFTKGTDIHLGKRPGLSIEERIIDARKELAINLAGIEKQKLVEKFKAMKQT